MALVLFFAIAALKLWPLARARLTETNRYQVAAAAGVVLAIVGFTVGGQFVSVAGLEVPYYVTMVGIALLKKVTAEAPASTRVPVRRIPYQPAPAHFRAPASTNP